MIRAEPRSAEMHDTPTTRPGGEASELPERPYLKPWYRIAQADGRMILEYAQSTVVFEGKAAQKLLPVLLPLLDGTRTVEEINAQLGEAAAPAIVKALALLAERGVLTEGPPPRDDTPAPVVEMAQFLSASGGGRRSVGESQQFLAGVATAVLGTGAVANEIANLLGAAGVDRLTALDWPRSEEEAGSTQLVIAAPDPHELPELEAWNRRALKARQPWLQVLPFDGHMAAIGPLYVPDETCCYECFRRRRAANVNFPSEDYWALEQTPATYPSSPPLRHMVAGLAATLALQWLSDRAAGEAPSPISATMHALAWGEAVELSHHRVYRVPRCRVCFPDDLGTPAPWHD
jgi:bacteriocin biosynthesis cyclodehydratase domain-containing protein